MAEPAELETVVEIDQSNPPVSNSEPTITNDEHQTVQTSRPLLDRRAVGKILQKWWNWIFVISCLLAVILDPLFVYIPLIIQDMKCIQLDKHMAIAALVSRSITDLVYIVKIILQGIQVYKLEKVTVMAVSYILIDILAIFPVPQVTVLIYFTKMPGLRSCTRKFLNFLTLIQYVPRVLRIYLSCKEIKNSPKGKLGLWIKGGLNFLMYIFASHIIGGFWYFFSVQRMMDCWQYACLTEDGCRSSSFNCQDHQTNDNVKLLNDSCPINPSDATVFDFGIFLDALQSGIVGSTDYSQKLSNCFWWGLRNLSSLGSNLQPSINTWENLFAAFTSVTGLLLFLYLIGKLQMYMQVESASKEQLRWKTDLENMMRTERKMRIERSKGPEVEQWLVTNNLPMRLLPEIMEKVVQVDLAENRDVDVENIHSILSLKLQSYIQNYKNLQQEGGTIELWLSENRLPMRLKSEIIEAVAQRPEFEQNGIVDVNNVLTSMPSHRKSYIDSYKQKLREKDEEVDRWLSENELPEALKSEIMKTVQSNLEDDREVDVENILSLLAVPLRERIREEMRLVKIRRKIEEKSEELNLWMLKNGIPGSYKLEIQETVLVELNENEDLDVENFISIYPTTVQIQDFLPFNRLKKISLLEALDERVLKAACEHLKPVRYDSDRTIIQEGEPLEMILFVEGNITFAKRGSGGFAYNCSDYIWGQELLVWPSSTSFPDEVLKATDTLSSKDSEVTALVLTDNNIKSIAIGSDFRPKIYELASRWLTRLKKVPKLQGMDEEVLKAIFLHLKQDKFSAASNKYVMNEPVSSMDFIIEGSIQFTTNDDDDCHVEVYGEELLDWVLDASFPALTPFAFHTASRNGSYTARLSITAEELKSVGSKFRRYFSTFQKESQPDLLTVVGLTVLKKVPKLKTMDEEVLIAISQHLSYKECNQGEEIIGAENPADRILFVLSGEPNIWTNKGSLLADRREFFGAELIDWLASSDATATRPLPVYRVTASYSENTRLLVLMANDLESVVSAFKSHFSLPYEHDHLAASSSQPASD